MARLKSCPSTRSLLQHLRKDFRVQIREEGLVQALHYVGDHVFFYHKRQVDLGSALRNHSDLDIGQFAENSGRNAGSVAQILPYQADDGLPAFILYVGQFGQVGGQRGMDSFESTVSDTLTSEVETTSTATRCRSK